MRLKQLLGAAIVALAVATSVAVTSTPASADYYAGLRAFDQKNYAEAAREWTQSALAGDPRSQFRLGILYAKGLGVPQNKETAYYWYKKADKQGNADAGIAAVFLKKELPPARARAIELRVASEGSGGGTVATKRPGGGDAASRQGNDGGGPGGSAALRSLVANSELRRIAPHTQGRDRYEIWKLNADGTVTGNYSQQDAGSVAYTHEGSDRGRWTIEGNALCVQWRQWEDGTKHCYVLTPLGRNKYRAREIGSNDTWTATIGPQ